MDNYKVKTTALGDYNIIPMVGGMVTIRNRAVLPFGQKSLVQNLRPWHPGFETRKGYSKLNTSAYESGTYSPLNIYQFVKGKVSEKHLFAQFEDGKLVEVTNQPPTTQATLGSVVHTGTTGQLPGAFACVNDFMIYSNGADQHQVYAGKTQPIDAFIVVFDTGAHAYYPNLGIDYTTEVTDASSSAVAVLDSMGDYATDYDAFYVMTKTPIDKFNFTISKPNGTAADLLFAYWNNTSGWANLAITDNTASGGATLAQSGTVVASLTATGRSAEVPRYMFGQVGYWYRFTLDTGDSLDAEVEISSVTYDCETFFPLVNIWNGIETDIIEAFHYVNADTIYYNYPGSAVTIEAMTSSDYLYFSSPYPLEGVYIDFGSTTNTTSANPTITYWNGSAWSALTEDVDGTSNMLQSGWIHWRRPADEQKRQFEETKYFTYWYRLAVGDTIDADVVVSLLGMPYFDINELGSIGRVSATWKNRALYTFNKFPRDIYVSESGEHMKLNGTDYAILQPGDGRDNATVGIVNFHNEIMVFQEEKGARGGCVTIFEGYSPATFGKLVLSTRIGSFSPKTIAVVDGAEASQTRRDTTSQTQCYFLSHYGVFMSDGRVVTCISDDIQNYFDPRFSECIRKGYEDVMWLEYDSTENLVKIGIVSGSSATACNKYFCYDIADGVWYEDTYAASLSVFREVEAGSGQFHTLQISGGDSTGYLYQMNSGTTDDSTAITWKLVWEFGHGPYFIDIMEVLTRLKVSAGQTYTWTMEENDVQVDTGTGSMAAEVTNYTLRRNRHLQETGDIPWITFTMTGTAAIYLYDMGVLSKVTGFK